MTSLIIRLSTQAHSLAPALCVFSGAESETKESKSRKVVGGTPASDRLEVLTSDPFNKVSHVMVAQ